MMVRFSLLVQSKSVKRLYKSVCLNLEFVCFFFILSNKSDPIYREEDLEGIRQRCSVPEGMNIKKNYRRTEKARVEEKH